MFSSVLDRLNDRRDAAGDAESDAGFTLIELMVVLLILAILLAIAIPTFLGVTNSANDRAAQSNLNTAMINAKAAYQSAGQTYASVNTTTLASAEPSLAFVAGASTGQGTISVYAPTDGNSIVLAAYSVKTKNCWAIVDSPAAETQATAPYVVAAGGGLIAQNSTGFPYTDAQGATISTPGTGTLYYKFANWTSANCLASNFGAAYSKVQVSGFPS
jgi:type IV pilus assembly protein PilA